MTVGTVRGPLGKPAVPRCKLKAPSTLLRLPVAVSLADRTRSTGIKVWHFLSISRLIRPIKGSHRLSDKVKLEWCLSRKRCRRLRVVDLSPQFREHAFQRSWVGHMRELGNNHGHEFIPCVDVVSKPGRRGDGFLLKESQQRIGKTSVHKLLTPPWFQGHWGSHVTK